MLRLTTADLMEALRGKDIFDPRGVSPTPSLRQTARFRRRCARNRKQPPSADLQLKVTADTAPPSPLCWTGRYWRIICAGAARTVRGWNAPRTANTVLPQEILLLIGNETEDYFLLKKEAPSAAPGGER